MPYGMCGLVDGEEEGADVELLDEGTPIGAPGACNWVFEVVGERRCLARGGVSPPSGSRRARCSDAHLTVRLLVVDLDAVFDRQVEVETLAETTDPTSSPSSQRSRRGRRRPGCGWATSFGRSPSCGRGRGPWPGARRRGRVRRRGLLSFPRLLGRLRGRRALRGRGRRVLRGLGRRGGVDRRGGRGLLVRPSARAWPARAGPSPSPRAWGPRARTRPARTRRRPAWRRRARRSEAYGGRDAETTRHGRGTEVSGLPREMEGKSAHPWCRDWGLRRLEPRNRGSGPHPRARRMTTLRLYLRVVAERIASCEPPWPRVAGAGAIYPAGTSRSPAAIRGGRERSRARTRTNRLRHAALQATLAATVAWLLAHRARSAIRPRPRPGVGDHHARLRARRRALEVVLASRRHRHRRPARDPARHGLGGNSPWSSPSR